MLKHIAAVALPLMLVSTHFSAIAQEDAPAVAGDAPPAYAQTAARLASAIQSGEDLQAHEDMFTLMPEEFAELAKLKGCQAGVQPAPTHDTVIFKWTCGDGTAVPGLSRTTVMLFDPDGLLHSFAINQPIEALAISAQAAAQEGVNTHRFTMRFARAATRGEDPGFGGALPLTELDRARLARFDGGDFWGPRKAQPGSQNDDAKTIRIISLGPKASRSRRKVYLYFDADDRPMGLIFAPVRNPAAQPRENKPGMPVMDSWNNQVGRRSQPTSDDCIFC